MVGVARALIFIVLVSCGIRVDAQKQSCSIDRTPPSEADKAMAERAFSRAQTTYEAMLAKDGNDLPAAAGQIRAELAQGHLDAALTLAKRALAAHPASALLEDVMGEVSLRRGEPEEAVAAFNDSARKDPCLGRTRLDVAHYFALTAMDASARKQIELAHRLSPEDLEVTREWKLATAVPLTPAQELERLRGKMAEPGRTAEEKAQYAEVIRYREAEGRGDCRLTGDMQSSEVKLLPLSNGPANPVYGRGLDVEINGNTRVLQLDTGASGLVITREAAKKAGLVPEAEIKTRGLGDDGPTGSFVSHVAKLRIGGMEFSNCMVRVVTSKTALDVSGLIGTDVFQNYLVTLDMPARTMRLGPLPKRPDQVLESKSLDTAGAGKGGTEGQDAAPRDRYIAPEMKDWTPIYRVGHDLIVPTHIGKAPTKLFILDTGASTPLISPAAAHEVTGVYGSDMAVLRGLSGKVKRTGEASSVTIQFADVRQTVTGMLAVDTSSFSEDTGVEIAGFLAFPTLDQLVIAIDYRDDLLHVIYDVKEGFHAR